MNPGQFSVGTLRPFPGWGVMHIKTALFCALFAALCFGAAAVWASPEPIERASDIQRPPTSRAILTLSRAQGDMSAMMFGNVHSLNTCLGLAVAATRRGWKESSATCLDQRGRAVTSYYCNREQTGTKCRVGIPAL